MWCSDVFISLINDKTEEWGLKLFKTKYYSISSSSWLKGIGSCFLIIISNLSLLCTSVIRTSDFPLDYEKFIMRTLNIDVYRLLWMYDQNKWFCFGIFEIFVTYFMCTSTKSEGCTSATLNLYVRNGTYALFSDICQLGKLSCFVVHCSLWSCVRVQKIIRPQVNKLWRKMTMSSSKLKKSISSRTSATLFDQAYLQKKKNISIFFCVGNEYVLVYHTTEKYKWKDM